MQSGHNAILQVPFQYLSFVIFVAWVVDMGLARHDCDSLTIRYEWGELEEDNGFSFKEKSKKKRGGKWQRGVVWYRMKSTVEEKETKRRKEAPNA